GDRGALLRQPLTETRQVRGRGSAPVGGRRCLHARRVYRRPAGSRPAVTAAPRHARSARRYRCVVDPTARFASLVGDVPTEPPLAEAALLMARHVHPALDVSFWVGRLDELAASCREATFDAVRHHLFVVEGFRGNLARYDDPANSLLDSVL